MAVASLTSSSAVPQSGKRSMATAERCVAFSRGVVFVTALAMLAIERLTTGGRPGALELTVGVGIGYALGTSVLSMVGRERSSLQLPLLVADMVLITGIIYLAGGVSNEYYLLYYLPILQASVRLNFRDAIASAVLSSALYGVVGLAGGSQTTVPVTAQIRSATFGASAVFMAAFFALLSREARVHLQRSREMADLAAALAAKNRELEAKSQELAEAQASLVASERLAAIGELAAGVGHELRNPLGVIRNAAYYLRTAGNADHGDAREMLALMDQQVASCDRTIAALLDFARPDQAHPEPMDLNSLVQTVLAEAPRPGSIGLQMDLEPDLPAALADSHQVSEVLGNLITNALQAMGDEGELRVRTWHDAGARQVLVEVSDTGPGIPEENLRRIFDPLFTTKAKGIGLGLVVCKRLVERQSGTLTVRSAEGEGAAFTVALPCVDR